MKNKKRINKAQDAVLTQTCIEIITDVHETPDFVEVRASVVLLTS